MAWTRIMGAESVRYHADTVLDRGDDFAGQALAYYGSRGETPMVWGGAGAARLGLTGPVTHDDYEAIFGPGGARDPILGNRLVATKRPGLELVVSAHKSVAVLGVIGRADDMHRILDAETDATIEFLDAWVQRQGGRRGRLQVRTPTSGLVYARTRHATSRAGDPNPHDHVLATNVVEMLDDTGGWKGLDTAGVRDLVHAATAIGRLHAAWEARRLGYGITPDHGPSGKLDHFAIAGIPETVCRQFSKRSDQIDDDAGPDASYRLRSRLARAHRPDKDHRSPEQLMDRWHGELGALGLTPTDLLARIDAHRPLRPPAERLSERELADLVGSVLAPEGPLAGDKQFGRAEVIRHLAPTLHGRHPDELHRALAAVLAHPEALPLVGQPGARNRAWVLASTRAAEEAIADCAQRLAASTGAVSVDPDTVAGAIRDKELAIGARLTHGQRDLVHQAAMSGRRLELVLGVAGAGKTTALDALRASFEATGHRALGTATSGQAAKTLGDAAHLHARTCASLLWRLQHGHEHLGPSTVLIIDEASMTDDRTMLALLTAAEIHGAKVIVVGDHHQLGAVGPGGGLEALVDRHPDAVHVLGDNIRQHDPTERHALEQLRAGDASRAVSWYADHGRIAHHPDRWDALLATTAAWQADLDAGHDTIMLAWRRTDVALLNHFARQRQRHTGIVDGTSIEADGGRRYSVGDRVVALAPDPAHRYVTSQRGTVTALRPDEQTLTIHFDGSDEPVHLVGEALDGEHLDHGYATTVHRAQGATVDRTHLYANGGGRELAYVAASRARDTTTIHTVADSRDQAIEDLSRDWSVDRRQRWTLDTDLPAAPAQPTRPSLAPGADVGLRLGRLRAERTAILAAMPADPGPAVAALEAQRVNLERQLDQLATGTGPYASTEIGRIAIAHHDTSSQLDQARCQADSPGRNRRQRRADNAAVARLEGELEALAPLWNQHVQPVARDLVGRIEEVDQHTERLNVSRHQRDLWALQHPTAVDRLAALNAEILRLEQSTSAPSIEELTAAHHVDGRATPGLSL